MSYVINLHGSTKHEQFLTLIDFSSRLTELRYLGTVISFREQVVKLDQASFPAKKLAHAPGGPHSDLLYGFCARVMQ